jgi:hypothetical protein
MLRKQPLEAVEVQAEACQHRALARGYVEPLTS